MYTSTLCPLIYEYPLILKISCILAVAMLFLHVQPMHVPLTHSMLHGAGCSVTTLCLSNPAGVRLGAVFALSSNSGCSDLHCLCLYSFCVHVFCLICKRL